MKIILATTEDLVENKKEILELMKEIYEINFRNQSFFIFEAEKLFSEMNSYIQDGSARILLALKRKKLIGLLWAYPHDYMGVIKMHINHFIIADKYRHQGLGQELLKKILIIAKENNIESLDLMASSDNCSAVKFYQKRGFKAERIYYSGKVEEISNCFGKTND